MSEESKPIKKRATSTPDATPQSPRPTYTNKMPMTFMKGKLAGQTLAAGDYVGQLGHLSAGEIEVLLYRGIIKEVEATS